MAVTVTLAGTDYTSQIDKANMQVMQILGAQRDTATLFYKKFGGRTYVPSVLDTVLIQDGSTAIFGGRIATITETNLSNADGVVYRLDCTDYTIDLDSELVTQTYTNQTVKQIIDDFVANFATGFTDNNTACGYTVASISFNQLPISQALKKLADLVQYNWYVDFAKDIHFFQKFTELSPFNLTDTSGNYVNSSLQTILDGTQIANQVKVTGGTYPGSTYSDTITVKGNVTKSWVLPYKFDPTTLTVTINGSAKTMGVYGIDTFSTVDVLYRDSDQSIQVASAQSDGDTVAYSGTPVIPVLAIASDAASIATYGVREKVVQDTTITDINVARQRAVVELQAYKDPLGQAIFDTYTAGLHAGQVINVNSSRRSVNTNYLIKQVIFAPRTPTTFLYSVQTITVKSFSLNDILQLLLLPTQTPPDPNQVNEIIKTDFATITTSENIQKDPLGAGVAPAWVLGIYHPSSITDTNRVICLDRDSAVLG